MKIELCIYCSPEDVYQDGEISNQELTKLYGQELPVCSNCKESYANK